MKSKRTLELAKKKLEQVEACISREPMEKLQNKKPQHIDKQHC